jgi:hypothetical protein
LLPNPVAFNQPDKPLLSSMQRRRLFDAKATDKAGQIDFDKASNAAWLPPQYSAMNCIIYDGPCTVNDVSIGGPLVTTVGENNLFFAIPLDNTYDCTPAYKYFVNGVYAGSWSSGLFNYTFSSSGYHTVEVRAYCDCSWFQQIHAGDFISVFVQPKPDVCPADSLTGCLTVSSETVATQPSNRSRRKIGVGEEVKLIASQEVEWSHQGPGKIEKIERDYYFIAGAVASKPKVTATSGNQSATMVFDVVAPSEARLKLDCYNHADENPVASVEWEGAIHVMPDDVSFYNIEVYEPYDPTVKGSTSGYFSYQEGDVHLPAGSSTNHGNKTPATNTVVTGFGTLFQHPDTIGASSKGTPYSKGSFLWNVPWNYVLKSDLKTPYRFDVVAQQKVMQADGTLFSTKGGSSANNKVNLSINQYCWATP